MSTSAWLSQIDENTQRFDAKFGSLSGAELNWKPNANTWSIAQNVDHIITINRSYYPVLEQVVRGTYKTPLLGRIPFFVNLFGKLILEASQPDRKKKMKTFPIWEPQKGDIRPDIMQQFKEQQEELKKLITACSLVLGKNVVISSPVNKLIVYRLETAFDIIITHEKRHFEQAKEVQTLMKNV